MRSFNCFRCAIVPGLLALAVLSGCARTIPPTGGEVPTGPLRVQSTQPAPFSQVDPFDGPVVFTFPRTLSERLVRGTLADAVEVSPQDGELSVRRRGNRVEVRMEGGFRRSEVYRVTLLPQLQDRFRNVQEDRVDLYFSTGPAFEPTVLAGVVVDRLTGDEVRGARVEVTTGSFPSGPSEGPVPPGMPPVHTTATDSAGVFLFRFLPPGAYEVRVYEDINRNQRPDFIERQGRARLALGPADTVVVADLAVLQPDTTPARLMEVTEIDSLHLSLRFDDPLDVATATDGVVASLQGTSAEGGVVIAQVARVLTRPAYEFSLVLARWEEARDAALAADEEWDEEAPTPPDLDTLAPESELIVVLAAPLPSGVTFTVSVEGLRNLVGLGGGGGEAEFVVPEAPAPAEPPADPDASPPVDPDPPPA
jgi:hypothetical protein